MATSTKLAVLNGCRWAQSFAGPGVRLGWQPCRKSRRPCWRKRENRSTVSLPGQSAVIRDEGEGGTSSVRMGVRKFSYISIAVERSTIGDPDRRKAALAYGMASTGIPRRLRFQPSLVGNPPPAKNGTDHKVTGRQDLVEIRHKDVFYHSRILCSMPSLRSEQVKANPGKEMGQTS